MEFIQSDSRKVHLPERVNVIISDIRGSLPLFGRAIASLEDARQRLLAPRGRLIPQRDNLKAAIIEADDFYSKLVSPWVESIPSLKLSPSLSLVLNESYTSRFNSDQLLTEPQTWAVLDYSAGAMASPSGNLDLCVTRAGTARGICLWFEAELLEGITYSSGPSTSKTIYGQVFLPWLQAIPVQQGQRICVTLQANLVGEEYVWRWDTKISGDSKQPDRCFRQSTFQGANFTPQALRRRASDFVPCLSEEGQVEELLLRAMDGKTSLQQMAQAAAERFPKVFPRWEDALHRAAELARQFSR
jgi:protein arginine N-methyltransferase 1